MNQLSKKYSLLTLLLAISFSLLAQPKVFNLSKNTGFIENKGQIKDQNRLPNTEVKYLYNGNGLNIHLKANSYSYELFRNMDSSTKKNRIEAHLEFDSLAQPSEIQYQRFDIEFIGANSNPQIIASEEGSDYLNYYTDDNSKGGISYVRHFKNILYKDLYPGIDLEFVLDKKQGVKFNFIIHPGAEASKIQWIYKGASIPTLNENQLHFTTQFSDLKEEIPQSFLLNVKQQKDSEISISYRQIATNCFGFTIPKYNKQQSLIIDPRPWATHYGGENSEIGQGVGSDANGNVYLGGETRSTANIASTGSYQSTIYAKQDAFIVRFNESGQRLWATYFGGEEDEYTTDLTANQLGKSVIIGYTTSTYGIATLSGHQSGMNGVVDGFIGQFDSTGQLEWASFYGGEAVDQYYSVTLDDSNFVYAIGKTESQYYISTPGAHQTSYQPQFRTDLFLTKFNANGTRIWSTYYGGSEYDYYGVVHYNKVDGHIYFTGQTNSLNGIVTPGAQKTTYAYGAGDAFLVKFTKNGNRVWGTYFGGGGGEVGQSIVSDNSGNIYISGETTSPSSIHTSRALQSTKRGAVDHYIAKYTILGKLCWSTYFGGNKVDEISRIGCQSNGNIILLGRTFSTSLLSTSNVHQDSLKGNSDEFLASIDSSCSLNWCTYYGGEADEIAFGLEIKSNDEILVAGQSSSRIGIKTPNAFQPYNLAANDAFIAQFSKDGFLDQIDSNFIYPSSICGASGDTLFGKLPFSFNGAYRYKWISSSTDSVSGFQLVSLGDTNQNLALGSNTVPKYYRRIVYSGPIIDTSNAIKIYTYPVAGIIVLKDTLCSGQVLSLFDKSSYFNPASLSYQWKLNDSLFSSLDSFYHVYDSAGLFSIQLKVESPQGCGDSISQSIKVRENPIAQINLSSDSICTQSELLLSEVNLSISDSIAQYNWDLGDMSFDSSGASLSHIYSLKGNYQINLKVVSLFGCSDSVSATLVVMPKPKAQIWTDLDSVCFGTSIQFYDSSYIAGQSVLTRTWTFADASSDTSLVLDKEITLIGDYPVSLYSQSSFGCLDTAMAQLFVHPLPNIGSINASVANPKANTAYTYSVNQEAGTSYDWTINNGQIQNGQGTEQISAQWTNNGPASIKLMLETENNCIDSVSADYIVSDVPVIVSFSPETGFRGEPITLKGKNFYGASLVKFGGVEADSFQFKSDSVVIAYPGNGNKGAIELTNPHGTASKSWFEFQWPLGIQEPISGLKIYPNPTSGILYIQSENRSEPLVYKVIDLMGKTLLEGTLSQTEQSIDLSGLAKGAYQVLLGRENVIILLN